MNQQQGEPVLYQRSADELASEAVVTVVASLTNQNPMEMEPLYGAIDPDSLDELSQESGGPAAQSAIEQVRFQFAGCDVTVYPDGKIAATLMTDAETER